MCTSGCVCKAGYVLDAPDGVCIPEKECPCHHGGKSYKEGSVIQAECNTCTCKDTKWECTDRICAGDASPSTLSVHDRYYLSMLNRFRQ